MIQKRHKQTLFFIQCGDWESVKKAESPLKACMDAIREAKIKFGKDVKLSSVVIAMNLHKQMEQDPESISAFTVNRIKEALRYEN